MKMGNWLLMILLGSMTVVACSSSETDSVFDKPETYVEYGKRFLNKENPDPELAARQFKKALELDPKHFDALISLGDTHLAMAKTIQLSASRKPNSGKRELSDLENKENRQDLNEEQRKKIQNHIDNAGNLYAKAHNVKPDSPYPHYKWGQLLFSFRNLIPDQLTTARKKMEMALKKTSQDNASLRSRIFYYLGGSHYFLELRKPSGKQDFSVARDFLQKYLDMYPGSGTPPREKAIEKLLMKIEERQETS